MPIDFSPSPEQEQVRQVARDVADRRVRPVAAALDREGRFPAEELRELAGLGLMGVNVPAEYGGAEAGVVAYSLAMTEIARACASTAVTMAVTNMVGEVIAAFGNEAQRRAYLPKLTGGEFAAGAFALSEPEAGSDPRAMRTTARRVPGGYRIDGQKQWITSGAYAGVMVVWARTGEGANDISCFLVEGGTPGLQVGRAEDKMGLRASNTVPLTFDGCEVPETSLLGEVGRGFRVAMMALDGGRIGIASQACGIASAALDEAVRYAGERKQFGRTIGSFQGVQWHLANSRVELDAALSLTLRAAWKKEHGRPFSAEAAMAKLYASEAANRICQRAVQVLGGYGYTREFSVERNLRDARVTTIYEGTSEIQRTVIGRHVLR